MKKPQTFFAALFLVQAISLPAFSQSIYERIDNFYEQRYLNFVDIVEQETCSQVIMAQIVDITTETYLQENPYSEPKYTEHVGRRIWLRVEHKWKNSEATPESVMTHGGSLPKDAWTDDPERVFECHSSIDISVEKGQRVIMAITLNNPLYSNPAWTWGGRGGVIDPDPKSFTFRSGEESAEFSPEVLQYLEGRKMKLINDIQNYLDSKW